MPSVTSRDGTRIAYESRGAGPSLILVDGTLASRANDFFSLLAALLSTEMRVVRYDRRGRNESGDTPPYAVEREVEDLEALIDEAGGSAFVYGTSSGAALALEAAARLASVHTLAVYDTPYGSPHLLADGPDDYTARVERLLAADRQAEAVELFLSSVFSAEMIDRMRASSRWQAMLDSAPTLLYDVAVANHGVLPRERVSAIRVPALVMHGGASWDFMRTTAREIAALIPGARYLEIPEQTHELNPRVLAPILREFFLGS